MFFNTTNICTDILHNKSFAEKDIAVSIVRLDKIHPIISGNKLFKLHYFLEDCQKTSHKTILTFGGAYSNHLVATAFACKEARLKGIGIVRGEQPSTLSHTLEQCLKYGMQLRFVSREQYSQKDNDNFIGDLEDELGQFTLVPEGGFHPLGAKGASLIVDVLEKETTHICCATGTATTIAGLVLGASPYQQVVGVNALKGINDTDERIRFLTGKNTMPGQLLMLNEYHFGGYAKQTPELIDFMNDIYLQYQIPIDFVYTAKMLFGIFDTIAKGEFPNGSRIACLHTGGLQGNLSLPYKALMF